MILTTSQRKEITAV